MIKILHVVSGLGSGGVETMLYNYYLIMDRTKIQFDFIVHDPNYGELESKFENLGCKIYHVTPKKDSFIKNANELYQIIHNGKYDIVHSHQNLSSFLALLIAKITKVRVRIAHSHVWYIYESWFQKLTRYPFKLLTKYFSTDWFACSKDASEWLFGDKENSNRLYIINNAIDIQKYQFNDETRKEVRSYYGWEDNFVVGNVARFFPEKNHSFLIDIFKEIHNDCPNAILLLIGGEGNDDNLRNKVNHLGLSDKILFFGVRNDVHILMQAMDVFILPSKFEGFGMVFVESQAASLKTYASTAVPTETKITDLIEYISLNDSPSLWAKKVLSNHQKYERHSVFKDLINSGFDIKSEALKLTNIYQSIYYDSNRN
ncbi:glycosyltransferase family 1 protein [Bacillus sp. E(2018)]|uniref:glycosyltransferase family 1 protein n=1 Tax=Bacillus sp. E(2018) TaxID=2502239 RepID=UPI0010F81232|nr:glycosyltransferase family 1 protein [Bacillus sp. E(2018)]